MTAKRITPIRWIAFLLALMLLPLGFLSAGQAEDDFEIEGTTLKRYRGKDETVVVPDGIEVLGSIAFDSCEMKQVILPETLTAIENCCFFGCPSLEEILLPASLTRIGDSQAFAYCPSLTAIRVAEGNTCFKSVDGVLFSYDGTDLLYYPDGKTSEIYEIPEGTEAVWDFSMPTIGKLVIPASVHAIGFNGINRDAHIGEFEVREGNRKFSSPNGLLCSADGKTLLSYPEGKQKEELTPADFPVGIEAVGFAALEESIAKTIRLPDSVREIDGQAFYMSQNLEEVVLPSVKWIGVSAFAYCRALHTVILPDGNAEMEEDSESCFYQCSPDLIIFSAAGGAVEKYCREKGIAFAEVSGTLEEMTAQAVEIHAQIEAEREAQRQREIAERLETLRREQEAADKKWAKAWPPKRKKEAATIGTQSSRDFNQTFFYNIEDRPLWPFSTFFLQGEDGDKETVTEYHVTFLSGSEKMRGFYYSGDYYDEKRIMLDWELISEPGTAQYRIDMVSEHYWGSVTADVAIADTSDYTVEVLSADVYVPVGTEADIASLYRLREFVKVTPQIGYDCYATLPDRAERETDSYSWDGWFTAKQPGDYPLVLRIEVGVGLVKEFPITVHASAETREAYVEGDAPVSQEGLRREQEEQERKRKQLEEYKKDGDEFAETEEAIFLCTKADAGWMISGILVSGTTLTIPAELNGHKIVGITDLARIIDGSNLVSLTVEEGITRIGRYAFSNEEKLETVFFPEGLSSVGEFAFFGCVALREVSVPTTLTKEGVGKNAFASCGLEDLVLADGTSLMAASWEAFSAESADSKGIILTARAGKLEYLLREDGGAVIVRSYSKDETLSVPDTLNGHPVKEIGAGAFMGSDRLKAIVLPEGLEAIGPEAFYGCEELADVTLPSTLKTIGSMAFCKVAAKAIVLPEGAAAAEDWYASSKQTDATGKWDYRILTDGTAEIVGYAYAAKIEFPAEVDGIPVTVIEKREESLDGRGVVTQIIIPEGVRRIGEEAFHTMRKLAKVTLPSTLVSIGEGAFYGTALQELTIPEGVAEIEKKAFYDCDSLKKLSLPSTLRIIGDQAFFHHSVKELTIPEGVERIGNGAFHPATEKSLARVVFNGWDTDLGKGIFGYVYQRGDSDNPEGWLDFFAESYSKTPYTLNITCWPGSSADKKYVYSVKKTYPRWGEENILTAPADRVLGAGLITPGSRIYELIIPEGVEEIAERAFADTSLCRVTFPSTLKKIGAGAFSGCAALQDFTLPKGLEELGQNAFLNCTGLTKVTLPDGLAEIPDHAFEGCAVLSRLTLPKTGLRRIGENAFYNCSALTDVKLPAGLEEIGSFAFGHTALKSAVIPDSVTKLGEGTFLSADITAITLPKGIQEIPKNLCYSCVYLKSVKIPEGVKAIGAQAFRYCGSLSSVTFPEGLVSIGEFAFAQDNELVEAALRYTHGKKRVTALKALKLPASLETIGDAAFYCCDALSTVTFAKGSALRTIGTGAFYACLSLKEIALPDSAQRIAAMAFTSCSGMTKANLGAGVTTVGDGLFAGCTALASVTVPDTLTEIGGNILLECGEKLTVTCGEGSAMETYLQQNYPDIRIVHPKK